jgi:curli biogenesis system outer membrane secretion channel CsgG
MKRSLRLSLPRNRSRIAATAARGGALALGLLLSGCAMSLVDRTPPLSDNLHAPVIAVTSFENRSGFEGQWKLGDGMADLLIAELVHSRSFTVVERQHFEGLVSEINRQKSGLFRPEGKTPVGRMKGAQYLIRGVINDFSQSGGGGLSVAFRKLMFLGHGYNARVSLTLTVIDIETGQILSAVNSTGIIRSREVYAEGAYKGVTFGGDVFFATPLGQATQRAIRSGVRAIARQMPENPWRPMISSVRDNVIIVNGGKDRGFSAGVTYAVRGPAEPVTDPATGDILTFVPGARIGTVRVTAVDEKISYAAPLQGSGFERGQWLIPPDAK